MDRGRWPTLHRSRLVVLAPLLVATGAVVGSVASMSNPFQIDGPAVISFSGGRTSGYMLRQILDEGLRPDVHVLFANTGKERLETLRFVHEIVTRWRVPVRWVERRATDRGFAEVSYATASRDGEPFEGLIEQRQFLPNPVMRFCTSALKIAPMRAFMEQRGYEAWTNVVGFRADEQSRVSRTRQREAGGVEPWASVFPLHAAGVDGGHVGSFWRSSPFDLQLRKHEGNCDLCFLKGVSIRSGIIRDRPDLAAWWIEQEQRTGGRFRSDSPTYADLLASPQFPEMSDDLASMECYCHD